jgi:uncharacterized damage-inducible protein DinB
MTTIAEYATWSVSERLDRMTRTPDELLDAIRGRSDAELSRRPDEENWSAKEIVCHLRDVEREYIERFHLVLDNEDPKLYLDPSSNERWPVERQYLRNETRDAVSAFRELRQEMRALLEPLTPAQLSRAGIHPRRGRVTIDWWVAMLAAHDDDHVDQLTRALDGRP